MRPIMTQPLYKLTNQFLQAADLFDNSDEFDDDTVRDTLHSLQMDWEEKAINVASYIKNLEAQQESIDSVAQVLNLRSWKIYDKALKLKNYLKYSMEQVGVKRVSSDLFDISIKENPGRLEIYDESKIDDRFITVQQLEIRKIDRELIKKSIKEGAEIEGARIIKEKRLSIK